jgi:hypothetical protein
MAVSTDGDDNGPEASTRREVVEDEEDDKDEEDNEDGKELDEADVAAESDVPTQEIAPSGMCLTR